MWRTGIQVEMYISEARMKPLRLLDKSVVDGVHSGTSSQVCCRVRNPAEM